MIYLSPKLERAAQDIVVAVVAHEIAHVYLRHKLLTETEYDAQDKAVFDCILQWGFGIEAKKHRALCKRRDSIAK